MKGTLAASILILHFLLLTEVLRWTSLIFQAGESRAALVAKLNTSTFLILWMFAQQPIPSANNGFLLEVLHKSD